MYVSSQFMLTNYPIYCLYYVELCTFIVNQYCIVTPRIVSSCSPYHNVFINTIIYYVPIST